MAGVACRFCIECVHIYIHMHLIIVAFHYLKGACKMERDYLQGHVEIGQSRMVLNL